MVHSMPLKNVSGQSYNVKIRTFGTSSEQCLGIPYINPVNYANGFNLTDLGLEIRLGN